MISVLPPAFDDERRAVGRHAGGQRPPSSAPHRFARRGRADTTPCRDSRAGRACRGSTTGELAWPQLISNGAVVARRDAASTRACPTCRPRRSGRCRTRRTPARRRSPDSATRGCVSRAPDRARPRPAARVPRRCLPVARSNALTRNVTLLVAVARTARRARRSPAAAASPPCTSRGPGRDVPAADLRGDEHEIARDDRRRNAEPAHRRLPGDAFGVAPSDRQALLRGHAGRRRTAPVRPLAGVEDTGQRDEQAGDQDGPSHESAPWGGVYRVYCARGVGVPGSATPAPQGGAARGVGVGPHARGSGAQRSRASRCIIGCYRWPGHPGCHAAPARMPVIKGINECRRRSRE